MTYHPGFAAEVVNGVERVDARDTSEMQTDHEVPEVLPGDHAVGMLANQDKVWLKGPAEEKQNSLGPFQTSGIYLCVHLNPLQDLSHFPAAYENYTSILLCLSHQ